MRIKPNQKTLRAITITGFTALAVSGGLTAYTVSQAHSTPAPRTCTATQPVYSNNDNTQVGTWQATLAVGQEVFLPDQDVATCQKDGTLNVEQP